MLKNKTAVKLYEDFAKEMPIVDYHCHINPKEVALDKKFENITELWLGGDHYKWRLIRSNGVPEDEITGTADPKTKFIRFAEALPRAIGNPLYHWTHLELKKYFGYDGVLNADTAEEVYNLCNQKLKNNRLSARGIIESSNVEVIGTTDDPIDTLEWHKKIALDKTFKTKVLPSFRPDKALNIDKEGFSEYINKLSLVCGFKITSLHDVKRALSDRLDFFCKNGCKIADHGLDYAVYEKASIDKIDECFKKIINGEKIEKPMADAYKTELLLYMAGEYHKRGVVMQLHYGVVRNANRKMFEALGADTGFDCISIKPCGEAIVSLLSELDYDNVLPKTILYSLNPADNAMLDTYIGAFQSSEIAGKIQHGSSWWFNDTKRGIEEHLKSLADLSVLGNFIGMLTDSRSFLSYTRHDYFRRILCNLIGEWVECGEYPNDMIALKEIIESISYKNAKKYFGF